MLPLNTRPYGIYFRPKVIYHPESERYLLWIKYLAIPLAAYRDSAYYLVAASSSPSGPFDEIITLQVNTAVTGAGDFDIFVEGDKAYLAYDAWKNNHQVVVEQLTANFCR